MRKTLLLFILSFCSLYSDIIETFYGEIEVNEPVLLELIHSPAFQRLKEIHQYGVGYYTTHREEFTRYEHSLGVFTLLRENGRSLEEQIAGLLHDVSHTVFSHVGDWIFNHQNDEVDYQSLTHADFIEKSGLKAILEKYGFTVEGILPKESLFPALERPLPNLCADRLDYNIEGAYHRGVLTKEEAIALFHEIRFIDSNWISKDTPLLKKLVRFSIDMSKSCWGSPMNYVLSMWLADAIQRGLDTGLLTMDEIRFGTDSQVWNKLLDDPVMDKLQNPFNYIAFCSDEDEDLHINSKYRGIDPLVMVDGEPKRLTSLDPELKKEFEEGEKIHSQGWGVKFRTRTTLQSSPHDASSREASKEGCNLRNRPLLRS